jgi:hypothetical protein
VAVPPLPVDDEPLAELVPVCPLACGVPGKSVEVLFCDMLVLSFEVLRTISEN